MAFRQPEHNAENRATHEAKTRERRGICDDLVETDGRVAQDDLKYDTYCSAGG
jgi:hypothetical protein